MKADMCPHKANPPCEQLGAPDKYLAKVIEHDANQIYSGLSATGAPSVSMSNMPGAYLHYHLLLRDVALLIVPVTGEFLNK